MNRIDRKTILLLLFLSDEPVAVRSYVFAMTSRRHSVNESRRSSRPNHCLTNLYETPSYLAKVKDLLTPHITMDRQWMGPAYRFPDSLWVSPEVVRIDRSTAYLLEFGFSDLIPELDHCQPVVAIVEGDKAVSVCQSVRKSEEAEEAGVDTLLSHRGKGYAAKVVAGWAKIVREQGRIPLYSTSWDNRASQRVAEKLGLQLYGVDIHIS